MADEDKKQAEKKKDKKAEDKPAEDKKETKIADKQEDAAKEEKVEVPAKFQKLVEEISGLSALELSELVQVLESHFGVSAAAPAAVAAAPAAGGEGEAEADSSKSEYTLVLKDAGDNKINVIKAVREVSGLGLAESKGIVDGAPKAIRENVPKDEAEEAKKKLEEAGATIELE